MLMKAARCIGIFLLIHIPLINSTNRTFVAPVTTVSHKIRLDSKAHRSSYPFLNGDTFRSICDFFVDETKIPFDPTLVCDGDIIFLNADYMAFFFSVLHPLINARYILLTHNSDASVPGRFAHYLEDEKLVAWFGQNVDSMHPKLFSIPIGIDNHWLGYWGNTDCIKAARARLPAQRDVLLYMNFSIGTNRTEREPVFELFKNKSFCWARGHCFRKGLSFGEYVQDLGRSKFVLSPDGNGIDCCRTWYSLLMGSIPIVKRSSITSMFEDMRVLVIDDWTIITEDFLNKKYEEMCAKQYNEDKVWIDYWLEPIKQLRIAIKNNKVI